MVNGLEGGVTVLGCFLNQSKTVLKTKFRWRKWQPMAKVTLHLMGYLPVVIGTSQLSRISISKSVNGIDRSVNIPRLNALYNRSNLGYCLSENCHSGLNHWRLLFSIIIVTLFYYSLFWCLPILLRFIWMYNI